MRVNVQIRDWLMQTRGVRGVKDCHIADAKEKSGLVVRRAWNRQEDKRAVPCPSEKLSHIQDALRHFGILPPSSP
jgi:hypothetical protein